MITREDTYKKAFENKSARVKDAEFRRNMLISAAYSKEPKLKEVDEKIAAAGSKFAVVAISGEKRQAEELKKEIKILSSQKMAMLKYAKVPPVSFECDICNDTGYVNGKICDCIKKEAAGIMSEELSREMPLKDCRFDNFDLNYYSDKTDSDGNNPKRRMTSIFKLCCEYAIGFSPEKSENLFFTGGVGLGKTHLTMAIVDEVIKKGYFPVYGSAENLFSAIEKEKFYSQSSGVYDAILDCDLLVIDDLGAEMVTSFTKSVIYNIINTRILKHKPTVINTNLSMKDIEERYTARVSSRLIGNYNANKFLGNDIRQQKLLNKK